MANPRPLIDRRPGGGAICGVYAYGAVWHAQRTRALFHRWRLEDGGIKSQRDLARATGLHEAEVSAILKGRRTIGPKVALPLAREFGVSPGWLMFGGRNLGWEDGVPAKYPLPADLARVAEKE